MPKGQYKRKERANKRQVIIEAAMKVFCFYGVYGASFELIAEEAGVSPSLAVKYFGSKEALLTLCVKDFMSEFSRKITRSAKMKNRTYREHVDYVFRLVRRSRNEFRFISATLNTPALEPVSKDLIMENLIVGQDVVAYFSHEIKPGMAKDLAYAMTALYFAYAMGGNVNNFLSCREKILETFLINS